MSNIRFVIFVFLFPIFFWVISIAHVFACGSAGSSNPRNPIGFIHFNHQQGESNLFGSYQFNCDGTVEFCPLSSGSLPTTDPVNYTPFLFSYRLGCNPSTPTHADNELGPNAPSCPISENPEEVAQPVNVATGNMYHVHADIRLPIRGGELAFVRTYNSLSTYDGPMGYGWTHTYDIRLEQPNAVMYKIRRGDGRGIYSIKMPNGNFEGLYGNKADLIENSDGSITQILEDGTQYKFDFSGKLERIEDSNGNVTVFSYDGSGKLILVTDPVGRRLTISYNAQNRIVSVTDPGNRVFTYSYDALGNLESVEYPDSTTKTYEYNDPHGNHLLSGIRGANNNYEAKWTFDNEGRSVESSINGADGKVTLSYPPPGPGGETIISNSKGFQTAYRFSTLNGTHRITEITGPGCASCGGTDIIRYFYDSFTNVNETRDRKNIRTRFLYDLENRLTKRFDAFSLPLERSTSFTYHPTFDLVSTVTDPRGGVTNFTYDANRNLTSLADPLNHATNFSYDAQGQLLTVTDAQGNATTFTYDTYGNVSSLTDALGNTSSFTYDLLGNLLTVTDILSQTTTYTYDSMNRLKTVTDPSGETTTYGYDPAGNLTQVADANGHSNSFAYDSASRLIQSVDPNNLITSYTYDTEGNLISRTDANGDTTAYTYDSRNRLTQKTYPDASTETFTYDLNGNLLTAANVNISYTHTYDALNRLTQVTDSLGKTINYQYDPNDNRTQMTAPGSEITTYTYDAANRLTSLTDPSSLTTTYTYDSLNRRTQLTLPNGTTAAYTYDTINRLTSLLQKTSTDTTLFSNIYTYDALGNRISMTDNAGLHNYTYDPLSRLIQATHPSIPTEDYTYDVVGNRVLEGPPITTDTDWDGLPDSWEIQFELDPNDPTGDNGALGDPDGDGFTNLQEYQGGSDPQDPNNTPTIEIPISSASGDQQTQSIAWNPVDKEYFVVWHDRAALDIRGARLDQFGNVIAPELPIVVDSERQAGPWVAYGGVGPNRGYMAVWIQGRGADPTGTDVHGVWVLPDGTIQDSFIVTNKTANQRAASVLYDPVADRFLVTWIDDEKGGSDRDIHRAVLLPGGGVYSGPTALITSSSDQRGPYARYDYGNNRYFMVWFDNGNGNFDVMGSRVDADGNLVEVGGIVISGASGHQRSPRITDRRPADGINNFTLAWIDFRNGQPDIYGTLIDQNGIPTTSEFEIAGGPSQQRAVTIEVDYIRTSQSMVSWIDDINGSDMDIYRAQIDQTGAITGPTLIAGQGTGAANDQRGPLVIYSADAAVDNGFLTLWRDNRSGADYDLYGSKTFPSGGSGLVAEFRNTDKNDWKITPVNSPNYLSTMAITVGLDPRSLGLRWNTLMKAMPAIQLPEESQYQPTQVVHQPPFPDPNAWVYDSANRLISRPGVTYTYDNNGNTLTKAENTGTTNYSYDFENRLTQISLPEGSVVNYQYDPFGRRISKAVNGTITRYLYDGEDILKEYDWAGTLLATYVHGPGIDEPISMTRGGQTFYYHADGLGSIIWLTNSSEAVVQTYEYDSFGNIINQTGTVQNFYTYTAREFDSESGLYYFRARYYDANIGRFITSDPIGLAGRDINLYRYVKDNPTNLTDPSGEILNFVFVGVTVAAIGLSVVFAVDTVIKFLEPAVEKKERALEELAEGGSGGEKAIEQIQEAQAEIAKGAELAAGFCKLGTAAAPTPLTK